MKWNIFKSFYPEKIYQPLVILLIILISYGQTLRMYFWNDDYTALYLAQHDMMFNFPYQWVVPLTKASLFLLGPNPFYFHLLALILYILAALLFFKFLEILKINKRAAFMATVLFASGYIGQQALFILKTV